MMRMTLSSKHHKTSLPMPDDKPTTPPNSTVVDNLPQVPQEKYEKLTAILRKIASASGRLVDSGFFHPIDSATGISKGFAFLEYENNDQARVARDALDGYQLDKAHKFAATFFDDLENLKNVPEQYQEPEAKSFQQRGTLTSWLADPRGRDQFSIRYADEAEIYWNDAAKQETDQVYSRSFWTEAPFLVWSPRGTYIATMHRQGAALWGGAEFQRLARFAHPGVQHVSFSSCERYLYTFGEVSSPDPRAPPGFVLHVFEVMSGRKLRSFEGSQGEHAIGAVARPDGGMAWPAFKWSGGSLAGPFLATIKRNAISVYAAPDMAMLDKKSVKAEGVAAFEWSPVDPLLCAYQEEQGNLPARVQLLKLPEREEIRAKNLFSVADVRMAWHPQGDYLAVRVEKWTKTRKSTTTNLELFSLRQRNVPVDMLELPNKSEKIMGLAWESQGHRFAVLHGDPRSPSMSIYSMKDPKSGAIGGVHLLHTATNRTCTSLHWSPTGRFLLLAGLSSGHNGKLEWWDADELTVVGAGEHFMATEVEWDPTGRYVVTTVTAINQMENGYQVWSFCGQPLYKISRDRFFQFAWRPRPPSLLALEKQREIAKNLKQYSKRYDEEDEALLAAADSEFHAERSRLVAEWRDWLATKAGWVSEQKEGEKAMWGARWKDSEEEFVVEEVEVTAVVDVKEEPAKGLP